MIPAGERQNFQLSALLLLYIAERAVVGATASQGLALVSERQPQTLFLRLSMHHHACGDMSHRQGAIRQGYRRLAIHFV